MFVCLNEHVLRTHYGTNQNTVKGLNVKDVISHGNRNSGLSAILVSLPIPTWTCLASASSTARVRSKEDERDKSSYSAWVVYIPTVWMLNLQFQVTCSPSSLSLIHILLSNHNPSTPSINLFSLPPPSLPSSTITPVHHPHTGSLSSTVSKCSPYCPYLVPCSAFLSH